MDECFISPHATPDARRVAKALCGKRVRFHPRLPVNAVRMFSDAPHSAHRSHATSKKWIKPAIRKPGILRAHVLRRFGKAGFDAEGRIRCDVLSRLNEEGGVWGRRARFAMNLRRMAGVPCKVR